MEVSQRAATPRGAETEVESIARAGAAHTAGAGGVSPRTVVGRDAGL